MASHNLRYFELGETQQLNARKQRPVKSQTLSRDPINSPINSRVKIRSEDGSDRHSMYPRILDRRYETSKNIFYYNEPEKDFDFIDTNGSSICEGEAALTHPSISRNRNGRKRNHIPKAIHNFNTRHNYDNIVESPSLWRLFPSEACKAVHETRFRRACI